MNTTGGRIVGAAVSNVIPFLFNNYSDLPSASSYHGAFAHVHEYGKGYFAHAGNWMELVNKETTGIVGTGTERYDIGYLDATNLYVSGITTLGSIGISTGLISGPAITYIDPATVGDNTGTLVVKGNLQVEGTQTTVNSTTMTVTDKNIEIAKGAANDAAADGAGITVDSGDGDKTWNWVDATDSWTSSEHIRIPDDKVFGFASDTNTYIGRPAADTFAFTNGGTERVRITTTGVGINTDPNTYNSSTYQFVVKTHNNANAGITIHSTSSGHGSLLFTDSGGNSAQGQVNYDHSTNRLKFIANAQERMHITSNGALGIGTNNAENLDSTAHDLVIGKGQASIDAGLTIFTGTDAEGKIFFGDSLASASDKKRGQIIYDHTDDSMQFATNAVEKVRIKSTGQVAIGTTVEGQVSADELTLSGSGSVGMTIRSTNSTESNIFMSDATTGSGEYAGWIKFKHNTTPNRWEFGAVNTQIFNILADGKVGINSDAPKATLDVNGGGNIQGDLNVTGITTTLQLQVGTLGHTMVGITTILDEDNFASNSATALATQQSIKAYVDSSNPTGSNLAVSADSGSNESINLATEVLDIEGTANEIETATGTNKVVIGLPDNVSVTGDVGIGASLNVTGISTFSDDVTFTTANSKNIVFDKDANDLTFGDSVLARFGDSNDLSIYHDSTSSNIADSFGGLNIKSNVLTLRASDNSRYVEALNASHVKLFYAGNEKLATSGVGVTVTGLTETDTLNSGNATFTGTISAGSTTGTDGYYLKSVGTGVTWAAFPSSRTGLTTTATAGQTSFNFSYNVGFVDVFVNGVKLPTSEFTANNGSTIVLDDAAFANDTLEFISLNTLPVTSGGGASNLNGLSDVTITGSPVKGETLQHNGSEFVNDYTVTATTTSTSQTAILSLPVATYRSAEYTIQVTEGTKYHVTKVLAIHDGTNVTFNEYGTLTTSTSLSTFALDVSSGNMRLLATPASTNSTAFKVKFTAIKV